MGRAIMIVTVLVLGMAPATAIATPQDVSATHAYIRANYAFTRATEAKVKIAQTNVESLNRKLAQQCPNVGVGSPQNDESQHLSYEVVVALWSVTYGTDAGAIKKFVASVKRLHWSSPKLARIAQSYASGLHELATLQMPDICDDVLAWKATGFKTVPAVTAALDRRVEAIETKTIPSSLLAPYVQPADRGILARTTRLEAKLQRTETVVGFNDWDLVLETLGLNQ
ncbi:MAG TPA: hypothetical protein VK781_09645 [Solirubrobacteraceae bacterium]|nr:hypothetical protein [Solirubrobacteraceae bacterium]